MPRKNIKSSNQGAANAEATKSDAAGRAPSAASGTSAPSQLEPGAAVPVRSADADNASSGAALRGPDTASSSATTSVQEYASYTERVQAEKLDSPAAAAPGASQAGPAAASSAPGAAPADPIETPSLFSAAALGGGAAAPARGSAVYIEDMLQQLDALELQDLLILRQAIEAKLPPANIQAINLEEELIRQYQLARELAASTAAQPNGVVPANQKAQVQNSCAAILKTLAEAQTALYTAERIKAIVPCLERAFEGIDAAVKERFFERYARLVRDIEASKNAEKQQFLGKR